MNCRHNRLRDVIAELLNKCLPEVSTEPPLLLVTGESLPRGTTLEPGVRLNILARGFYSPIERAFFDVGVSHPGAPTNSVYETPAEMYAANEMMFVKKLANHMTRTNGQSLSNTMASILSDDAYALSS